MQCYAVLTYCTWFLTGLHCVCLLCDTRWADPPCFYSQCETAVTFLWGLLVVGPFSTLRSKDWSKCTHNSKQVSKPDCSWVNSKATWQTHQSDLKRHNKCHGSLLYRGKTKRTVQMVSPWKLSLWLKRHNGEEQKIIRCIPFNLCKTLNLYCICAIRHNATCTHLHKI